MPSHRYLTYWFLLFLGLFLIVGNIFCAARRSTIPLRLESRVVDKEQRIEKRPGKDDVFLIHLASGDEIQVDRRVFEAVNVGVPVHKAAWSRTLDQQGQSLSLVWSRDFYGMILAMPAIFVVMLLTAGYIMWSSRPPAINVSHSTVSSEDIIVVPQRRVGRERYIVEK